MKKLLIICISIFFVSVLSSCSYLKRAAYADIEIAPQKLAYMKFTKNKDMLLKQNEKVLALGKIDTYYEPVTIMEHNGMIYLIMLDERGNRAVDIQLEFYKQAGDKMERIKPSDFPRSIAIQNFLAPGYGIDKRDDGSIRMDNLQIARARNPNDSDFRGSITANIWYYLETEKPFHTIYGGMVDADFLKNYMEKYKPVMLDFKEMRRVTAKEAGF